MWFSCGLSCSSNINIFSLHPFCKLFSTSYVAALDLSCNFCFGFIYLLSGTRKGHEGAMSPVTSFVCDLHFLALTRIHFFHKSQTVVCLSPYLLFFLSICKLCEIYLHNILIYLRLIYLFVSQLKIDWQDCLSIH